MQYVVIIGNLITGIQTVHGPFKDQDHAYHWIWENVDEGSKNLCVIQPLLGL